MSVIQLSANHICAVAVGVTKLLNNVPAVNYVFLKDNTRDALNAAFKDCKGESKYSLYPYEEANVFTLLAGINARAYVGRYDEPAEAVRLDEITEPRNLLKTPKIVNQHYEPGADWFAWAKLLESYIYQCDGDTTGSAPTIKALELLLVDVKLWIFNHLDIYDRAPWTI